MPHLRLPFVLLAILGLATVCHAQHHRILGGGCQNGGHSCQSRLPSCCTQGCTNRANPWAGIYPTVLTPWRCDGCLDEAALEAEINYQLQGGVNGLLILGTIGEGEYVNMDEREQVIKVAVKTAGGKVPVVAGIHTWDIFVARDQLKQAKELGANAVLIKYVGDPTATFAEVHTFFKKLTELNLLPIFYYHYPSQTKLCLTPNEVAQILLLPGVVGIKESTLDLNETQQHIALTCGQDKVFLSGTALNLTQFMGIGGQGAMCPEAALLPAHTVAAYNAYLLGDRQRARRIQRDLFVVAPLLRGGMTTEHMAATMMMTAQDHKVAMPMGEENPQARLKAALNGLGICMSDNVKCGLPPLSGCDALKVRCAVSKMRRMMHTCP